MISVAFLETSLRIGGSEHMVTQLVRGLDRARFQPFVCCLYEPGTLGEQLLKEGHTVYHNLAKNRADALLPLRLGRILKRERTDVLFIINQPITQFWGTWASLLAQVPVRITAIRSTGKVNRIRRRLWINRLTFPCITCVTALSETHKRYLVEKEGIDPRKMEIIANGVDLDRFTVGPKPEPLMASLGLPTGAPIVGIVAMLRPEKGYPVFLEAACDVLNAVPEAHFAIVGDGSERSRLEKLASDLGVSSQVHFLGARRDIPELLKAFDVTCLSSYPVVETLSNSVLEYMAAGKPVVATRVGSLPEVIVEGETGFLVEPGDAKALAERIVSLLCDSGLRRRMGDRARQRAESHYSLARMVKATERLFETLLGRKNEREAVCVGS